MSRRPLGMSLLCGFFGLVGLGTLISGFSMLGAEHAVPAGEPDSVRLFLTVVPLFGILHGSLGLFAAVTLWKASPLGRLAGLAWTGLWIAEEGFVGAWAAVGPRVVREANGGPASNVLRMLVGGYVFYYLWISGRTYVSD